MEIPYGKQYIDNDDIEEVIKCLKSDYITTGPRVEEFEKTVADYVGAKYAVAVANGTAALHLACLAAGIKAGDEVITTPITFVASSNCVLYCGGTPVFADVNQDTYNIDAQDIRRKITKRTKAIIPVHFGGQPCEMDRIREIAQAFNLQIIEDASHALGASYHNRMIGNVSDMTTFSFHPVKHITTGEGGMITTNNKELYDKLILYRGHGINRDISQMTQSDGAWYYQQVVLGYNYRITDIQCALGISQMKKLDCFIKRRIQIAEKYNGAFEECKNLKIPLQKEQCQSSWHLYVIQVKNGRRKEVFDQLRSKGIYANVHYIPVYSQPYYRENGYKEVTCENAEKVYKNFISLPMYPALTESEQDYVIENVKEVIET